MSSLNDATSYERPAATERIGTEALAEAVEDTLSQFFTAQRLDFNAPRRVMDDVSVIMVDDDRSLVNSFVAVERRDIIEEHFTDFLAGIRLSRLDPARTELIIASEASPHRIRAIGRDIQSVARRAIRLPDFLDEFLRPGRLCLSLLEPGTGESNSPGGLLYEDDFIEPWATATGFGNVSAIRHLVTGWARGNTPRLCMLLAPAGYGKSKLTHILAKRLARAYDDSQGDEPRPPIPMLIPFGQYRRSTAFSGLILSALDMYGNPLLTIDAFRFLVGRGRVLFILDGYDEMIESYPDTARGNIAEFIANSGPDSRILLTSRSVFYRTTSDVVGEVGDPLLSEQEVELLELRPFDEVQAREFLRRSLADPTDKSRRLERAQELLRRGRNMEIMGSPFFLAEFAALVARDKWSMADVERRGGLEFLIGTTFARERERQDHGFTDVEQRRFLERIAFDMLLTGTPAYTREDLELFTLEAVEDPEELARNGAKLWTHHFLHTYDGADASTPSATMRHQVWRDYFQGTGLVTELARENPYAFVIFQSRDLPEGVLRATTQANDSLAEQLIFKRADSLGSKGIRNALRMSFLANEGSEKCVLPQELRKHMRGHDLSDMTFRGIDFEGLDLSRADLSGTHLESCDLHNCSFEATTFSRTTLVGCRFDAGIAEAEISSVSIDGKQYFGPQLADTFSAASEPGQAAVTGRPTRPLEFHDYAERILRERLGKFAI